MFRSNFLNFQLAAPVVLPIICTQVETCIAPKRSSIPLSAVRQQRIRFGSITETQRGTYHRRSFDIRMAATSDDLAGTKSEINDPSISSTYGMTNSNGEHETEYGYTDSTGDGGSNDGNDNDNSNTGNHGDEDDDDEGNNSSSNNEHKALGMLSETMARFSEVAQASHEILSSTSSTISTTFSSWVDILLKTVPAPVLVALISLSSTILGTRYKSVRDARHAELLRIEASRKRRNEKERELRIKYDEFAGPILKSAAKLAERLEFTVTTDWSAVESLDGDEKVSPTYSAFLLGRFLAHVEILKRERPLLDYGFPAADRILANILGRIQGVLNANNKTLKMIQETEHVFKPGNNDKPIDAGVLKISPRKQTVLGELMLRRTWVSSYGHVIRTSNNNEVVESGSKAVLSFLEFSHILKYDNRMKDWYKYVISEFSQLEQTARNAKCGDGEDLKKRAERVGSRIYILQSGLLDLVEFFDPLPHPKSVPIYQRTRLEIGPNSHKDTMRSPLSLRKLYGELSNFREHRQYSNSNERLALPNSAIEVFVTGAYDAGDPRTEQCEHGNCPSSHRVLITLKEMNIPYRTIPIAPDNKPSWYYLLHPLTDTPLVYYNGDVISDSANIVSYLIEKFQDPKKYRSLASADKLKLAVGTSAFIKFHSHFMNWMSTNDNNGKLETEKELRKLEETLLCAQKKHKGMPFLGGERFSREDTAIVPFLHVVEIAGRRLKGWSFPEECQALRTYLEAARAMPSFEDSGAAEDAVLRRMKAVLSVTGRRNERLADMLE